MKNSEIWLKIGKNGNIVENWLTTVKNYEKWFEVVKNSKAAIKLFCVYRAQDFSEEGGEGKKIKTAKNKNINILQVKNMLNS